MSDSGKKRCAGALFWLAVFLLLLAGLWYNLPNRMSGEQIDRADSYSNNIMLADLLYHRQNGGQTAFLVFPKLPILMEPYELEHIVTDGGELVAEKFIPYRSNLVAQRYLYRFMDKVLPLSPLHRLRVIELVTVLFAALTVTMVLWWVSRITSGATAAFLAAALACFGARFTMLGRNLYWCIGSIWLPMAAMGLLVCSKRFQNSRPARQCGQIAAVAFISCAVKQAVYFEFVSTAMIAMAMPVVFWLVEEGKTIRAMLKSFFSMVGAALASFAGVFLVRLAVITCTDSWEHALQFVQESLVGRVLEGQDEGNEMWAAIADASYFDTVAVLAQKSLFSIRSCMDLTAAGLLLAVALCTAAALWRGLYRDRRYRALLAVTLLSILAPVSWCVMAKPHVWTNFEQCAIMWYCPFAMLGLALVVRTVPLFIRGTEEGRTGK